MQRRCRQTHAAECSSGFPNLLSVCPWPQISLGFLAVWSWKNLRCAASCLTIDMAESFSRAELTTGGGEPATGRPFLSELCPLTSARNNPEQLSTRAHFLCTVGQNYCTSRRKARFFPILGWILVLADSYAYLHDATSAITIKGQLGTELKIAGLFFLPSSLAQYVPVCET